jgi:hypothetical protein
VCATHEAITDQTNVQLFFAHILLCSNLTT